MKKEIKFRAWNKERGEMFYTDDGRGFVFCISPTGGCWIERLNGKSDLGELSDWMQFTGIKDEKGKEIYEGDILRSKENEEVYRVDSIVPVHRHTHLTNIGYYSGKKYHSRTASAAYDNLDDWMSWPEMYKIIGNIHENPDLLASPSHIRE